MGRGSPTVIPAQAGNCVVKGSGHVVSCSEWLSGAQHCIEGDEQLAGDGDDGDLGVAGSRSDVAVVERQSRHLSDGCERCHVEGLAHALSAAANMALAAESAAIIVEGSEAGERGNGLCRALAELGQEGDQRDSCDWTDTWGGLQLLAQRGEFGRAGDQAVDNGLQAVNLRIDPGNMGGDAGAHVFALSDGQTLFVVGTGCHQLVAAALQAGEALAQRVGGLAWRESERAAHVGEQAGVESIGLGQCGSGSGEVAGAGRVDAHVGKIGGLEGAAQDAIVASCGLEDHAYARLWPGCQRGRDRDWTVGNAPGLGGGFVIDIEMRLADIDSDEPVGYGHGPVPVVRGPLERPRATVQVDK